MTGDIDLIALLRVRNHDDVAALVPDRINKVPGIVSTETHIAFRRTRVTTSRRPSASA